MNKPRIAVIYFPGINCQDEAVRALAAAGLAPFMMRWNEPANLLSRVAGIVLPGGFSYEDRARSGVIAAHDPLMKVIARLAQRGMPVLGICNGAQILVESGLIPGVAKLQVAAALARNIRQKNNTIVGVGYLNRWVYMQQIAPKNRCALTTDVAPGTIYHMPIAHGEGRWVFPKDSYQTLEKNGQIVYRYCDAAGKSGDEYPENPNGAEQSVAAVCNAAGNVVAMMPHPERNPEHALGPFVALRRFVQAKRSAPKKITVAPAATFPAPLAYTTEAMQLTVRLIIADNEAISVENALRQLGLRVTIGRVRHWEIELTAGDRAKQLEQLRALIQSGELLNTHKEDGILEWRRERLDYDADKGVFVPAAGVTSHAIRFLVRDQADALGDLKLDTITRRLHLPFVRNLRSGTVWEVSGASARTVQQVLATNIFANPYSQLLFRLP